MPTEMHIHRVRRRLTEPRMPDMTDRRGGGPAAGGRGRQLTPGSVRLADLAGLGTAPFGSWPSWELDWGPFSVPEPVTAIRAAVAAGVG